MVQTTLITPIQKDYVAQRCGKGDILYNALLYLTVVFILLYKRYMRDNNIKQAFYQNNNDLKNKNKFFALTLERAGHFNVFQRDR